MSHPDQIALASVRVLKPQGTPVTFGLLRFPAYIGTDDSCAVKLDADRAGDTIAAKHAQLLRLADGRFRLVNLTDRASRVHAGKTVTLAAHDYQDLNSGDSIEIGSYSLQVQAGDGSALALAPSRNGRVATIAPRTIKSKCIELRLVPQKGLVLEPGGQVILSVFIKNVGDARDVKFVLDVIGVDAEFCRIDEGPTLNPGQELGVTVTVAQPAQPEAKKLPAEDLPIGIRVSAQPYFGQPAEAVVTLSVAPVYLHDLFEER